MLVVRVELHSAVTGNVTEIGRMVIANVGGTQQVRDYKVHGADGALIDLTDVPITMETLKKPHFGQPVRTGSIEGHKRLKLPVWSLVAKCLNKLGYADLK